MTMLIGSVPCRLPVVDGQTGRHEPDHHGKEQMLQVPRNVHEEMAKRPRWMSVEGREIVGPGFSTGPRVCATQPKNRNGGKIRRSGLAEKTTASRTAPEPHWCPPWLTHTQRRWVQKLRAKEI
jgi:hypothetical protein